MIDRPDFFEGTEMPAGDWWRALFPEPEAILNSIGMTTVDTSVDLCAGNGWFALPLSKCSRQVVAIDIDADLLDAGRRRLAAHGASNCLFVEGDARDVDKLCPRPADFIWMANAFHGVPDRAQLIRAVRAALKSDGRFAILNWHHEARDKTAVFDEPRGPRTVLRISPQETIHAAETAGLVCARLIEVPPYHYAVVFEAPR